MLDDIPDRLLERYCAGDCAPSEQADVERWLAADPSRADYLALLAAARREIAAAAAPAERPDARAAWERVRGRVHMPGHPPLRIATAAEEAHRRTPWRRLSRNTGIRAAAAALVLAVGGALLFARVTSDSATTQRVALAPAREIVTRRGQRAAFDLPDGSRVVVAADSRLRVPAAYGPTAGPRELFLEGEAYFEVRHDSLRPFRVRAANGVVEDIGTTFVVTAYPETRGVQVVVADGAVALRAAASPASVPSRALLTLGRGQLGRLDSTGTATLTREVALAPYVAWTTGSLVFDSTRMRDAVPRLARWFDLDIHLADSGIAERRLTTALTNETAQQALEVIALSLDLRIEKIGRRVVLSRSNQGSR